MRTPLCSMSTCSHARHSQSPFRLSTCILQWLHFSRSVGVYFIVFLSQGSSHPTLVQGDRQMLIYPLPASGGYIYLCFVFLITVITKLRFTGTTKGVCSSVRFTFFANHLLSSCIWSMMSCTMSSI